MKKKKVMTNYTYMEQDTETGSQCEHVLVLFEEEPDPTKSVACCKQCPNGWDNETHYTKGKSKKPWRIVRTFRCSSMYRKGATKIKDPDVIDKNCPYRKMDAGSMV